MSFKERLTHINKKLTLYTFVFCLILLALIGYYKFFIARTHETTITGYSTQMGSLNQSLLGCETELDALNSSLLSCSRDLEKKTELQKNLTSANIQLEFRNKDLLKNISSMTTRLASAESDVKDFRRKLNQTEIDRDRYKNELKNMTDDFDNCTSSLTDCRVDLDDCRNP